MRMTLLLTLMAASLPVHAIDVREVSDIELKSFLRSVEVLIDKNNPDDFPAAILRLVTAWTPSERCAPAVKAEEECQERKLYLVLSNWDLHANLQVFANGAVSGAFAAAIASTTKPGTSDTETARTKTVRWDGEGDMPEHLKAVASEINEGLAGTAKALNAKAAAGKLEYYDGKSEIQIFNETDHIITNDMGFAKGHGFTAAQTNLVNGNTVTTWYGISAGRYLGTPDLNVFAVSHELAHALPGHGAYTFGNHSAYLANPIPFENAANEYASTLNGYRY